MEIAGNLFIPSDIFIMDNIPFFQGKSNEKQDVSNSNTTLQLYGKSDTAENIIVGNYAVTFGESEFTFIPPYNGEYAFMVEGLTEEQIAGVTVTNKEGVLQEFYSKKYEGGYEIVIKYLSANEEYIVNISID